MNHFVIMIKLAFKRFFTKKRLFVFLLVLIISLAAFHMGVMDYKDIARESKDFNNVESFIFNHLTSWDDYADVGAGVFFRPAPEMVFFAAPIKFAYLNARINTIADLDIMQGRKGKSVISRGWSKMVRVSNVMLFIATLLSMLVGYIPMRDRGYLRQLAAVSSPVKTYAAIMIAGFFILVLGFLVIAVCIFLLGIVEGVVPSSALVAVLASYLPIAFLMLLFFLTAGSLTGNIRTKSTARTVLFSVWFIFVFVIPVTFDAIAELDTNNMISALELHGKKLIIVKDFEVRAVKESGKFENNTKEGAIKVIEGYWDTDYKKLEDLEKDFLNATAAKMKRSKNLSLTCITTFYQSVCDELSSNGYTGYLDFYSYLIKLRREFMRFWIDRVFYERSKEVKNFITGNENLYFSRSTLPDAYWGGIAGHGLIVMVLLFAGYFVFKRLIVVPVNKDMSWSKVKINFPSNLLVVISPSSDDFNRGLVNTFFGAGKDRGEIIIDGKAIDKKAKFLYISKPDDLPKDVKVADYLQIFKQPLGLDMDAFIQLKEAVGVDSLDKRLGDLSDMEKADLLLKLAEADRKIPVLLNHFGGDYKREIRLSLQKRVSDMKNKNILIIDMVNDAEAIAYGQMMILLTWRDNAYSTSVHLGEDRE